MRISAVVLAVALAAATAFAQGGPPPAAKVSVAKLEKGSLTPAAEFTGVVYFKEIAGLATEASGQVESVLFEEGDHLDKGAPLIRLDDDLLSASLATAKAMREKDHALLKLEETRLERARTLLKDEVTTQQEVDDLTYTVQSLEHGLAASGAEVRRLEIELAKKTTYAPFDGVVVERQTELGEWKSPGSSVAVFARDDLFDVIVNLPETRLRYVEPGLKAPMVIAGRDIEGEVVTTLPQGDIKTQTFPVKLRVKGQPWLLEGMSALVRLPIGEEAGCCIVPRDAVLKGAGGARVVTIKDGKAVSVPVEVVGNEGLRTGLKGDGLEPGMTVIVKGHERLRDGQPVEVAGDRQQQAESEARG